MNQFLLLICLSFSSIALGQYPFEKHSGIKYKEHTGWKVNHKDEKDELTLTTPKFFNSKDALAIEVNSFPGKWDSSYITLSKQNKQMQRIFEPMFFTSIFPSLPVRVADINGDGLKDVKMIVPYMGNGLASMNVRIIYLFQKKDKGFIKISYLDKIGEENRAERDFDGDGNYEIITQTLRGHKGHNYWVFNLFNFRNGELVSVNDKFNYPIMIQYLYKENYKITDKISRKKMKEFAFTKPEEYDRR